jgi:hypothetical protein
MAALAGACGKDGEGGSGSTTFESDLPSGSSAGHGTSKGESASGGLSGASAPTSSRNSGPAAQDSAAGNPSFAADRAIAEADIIQMSGDHLFALSRVAGLAVIDASDPAALKLLGRYREIHGTPFEMYLRGDTAVLMFSGWAEYTKDEKGNYASVTTSKIVALDVSDPGAISERGTFDVAGTISDSRVVGDVLYVVGYEDGYCWRCEQNKPTTTVSSLNLADPSQIRKVDQLRYADTTGQWSWQRSVTVTNQRMYVAGPEYDNNGPIGSTIQVVDISDPAGDLVPGATLQARGQISSRWQMDEYQGVLRVVSQSPAWRTTELPQLQTFKVSSSTEIHPLAKLDIIIPARESIQSARFDGPRGYLITAERRDPLFTLDLSNPASPRQVGELEMPGFVYHMEPRGDRVLGLGFDQNNPEGAVTVSLFDVSDFANPKMLSRVNFGGNWASLPEDQDRIHKVFRVLDDEGMILVPFQGYSRVDSFDYCGGKNVGGVQLIDFANDTLKARGSAQSDVQVRRALVHNEHLLAVSDQSVESFTMTDRDELTLVSKAVIANTVRYAAQLDGDIVARLVSPDWGTKWAVETTSVADAENIDQKLGELDLTGVFKSSDDDCNNWWSIQSYYAHGSTLYLLYSGYRQAKTLNESEEETGVVAIDVSDPAKPRIAGRTSWVEKQEQGKSNWYPYYGDFYGGYGQTSQYVWHEGVLAFLEQMSIYDPAHPEVQSTKTRLHVVDLSNPEKLSGTTLALGDNRSFTGLVADGDQLITTRADLPPTNVSSNVQTRVRFFADRIDVSKPSTPKVISSVNVPGVVAYLDSASSRAITSQLHRVVARGLTSNECWTRFAQADFEFDNPNGLLTDKSTGTCNGYTQSLQLITLRDDSAVLEDTYALAEDQQISTWAFGDGRVFATVGKAYYGGRVLVGGSAGGPTASGGVAVDCFDCGFGGYEPQPVDILVLSGFAEGEFEVGKLTVKPDNDDPNRGYWWGYSSLVASGDKAIVFTSGSAAIVDGSDAAKPKVTSTVTLLGSPQSFDIKNGTALVALGDQGVQRIDL